MKLSPLEIKQQKFEKVLRGYDTSDVQAFLTLVANEVEILINEKNKLEDDIEKLTERVKHYERIEDALHETLQTTKESISQKLENAKIEARSIIDKASMEAETIIKEATFQRQTIRQGIIRLLDRREEILTGIQTYLDNTQSSLKHFAKDELNVYSLPKEEEEAAENAKIPASGENTTGPKFQFDENELDSDETNASGDSLDDILEEID